MSIYTGTAYHLSALGFSLFVYDKVPDDMVNSACVGVLVRSISFLIRSRTRLGRLLEPGGK